MAIALNDEIRRLLDGPNYAVLATINPDPEPDAPGAVRLILRMTIDKATGYAA